MPSGDSEGTDPTQFEEFASDLRDEVEDLIRRNFVNGRVSTAENVNSFMVSQGNFPAYKAGTLAKDQVLNSITVYCVEYKNPPIGREGPGKWLSYDSQYTSLEQVINKFALKKEFKDPLINGGLVLRKYTIKSPLKVRNGVVGELYDDFYRKSLNGGANQLQVLENNSNWYSGQWRNFLTYVEDITITN